MIIQCDQCNTKFKLDDAKVPDKGVKVRCARCKNIFLVQKEAPAEEPDFDVLLSGLGAPSPGAGPDLPQEGGAAPAPSAGEEGGMFGELPDARMGEGTEPSAATDEQHGGRDDFGEDFFAFKEEASAQGEKGPERGEFPFEEEAAAPTDARASAESGKGEAGEFDFGEYTFSEGESETTQSVDSGTPAGAAEEAENFDFGAVDFGPGESLEATAGKVPDVAVGEEEKEEPFSPVEPPPLPQDDDQGVEWQAEPAAESTGEFVFSTEKLPSMDKEEAESSSMVAEEEKQEAGTLPADFAGLLAEPSAVTAETAKEEVIKPVQEEAPFIPTPAVEQEPVPPVVPVITSAEEELPPLAISTRKKGSSILPVAVTAIAILIVLAVAGLGFYVFNEGPAAFDKLGLSSIAKLLGMKTSEAGSITVKNPHGAFMVNKEAGEIFVVSGEAVNNFKEARASIQVKATVLGPKGEALLQKTAYCGNALSREQLATLPMAKIEEAMESPFGDSLANLGVQPGKGIPFVIVFSGVPKTAGEFSVEVVGSTLASQ
jgi:predicted Zn finger-like uncharacterized protein